MRIVYRVTRRSDGQWQGRKDDAGEAIVVAEVKSIAEQQTFDLARSHGDAHVFVYDAEGYVCEERTYALKKKP